MKNSFLIPVLFLFLLSCEKEDPTPLDYISNISFLDFTAIQEEQEIQVTINKASPCQYVGKTDKTVSGNTFNYNFILEGEGNRCVTIFGIEEIISVNFNPTSPGQYTLNFLINGKLYETRMIMVNKFQD